jgi:CheY-like chemotaxis protein
VLVVDDDPRLARSYRRILQRVHEVQVAGSGTEAMSLLERDSAFDVIICDIYMPEVSGRDLFCWLSERLPRLTPRVVFISGGVSSDSISKFLDGLDNRRLQKPVMPDELREVVARMVEAGPAES